MVKGVDLRFESTLVVVVRQRQVDWSKARPGDCVVGMAVELGEDVEAECRKGAEDAAVAVAVAVVNIPVAATANKIAGKEGIAAVVVCMAMVVAAEFVCCVAEDTFGVGTEVVML